MPTTSILLGVLLAAPPAPEPEERPEAACADRDRWTLVAHGGAGAWSGSPEKLEARRAALRAALAEGAERLARGETAVDAIEAVVVRLEDAPVLNAGRGGVPNQAGFVELDAAIMRGEDRAAGAVAGLRTVKNPIRLARAVMERSRHVLMVDRGAEAWARAQGLEVVDPAYFLVPRDPAKPKKKSKAGTVGAVALDRCGRIAAATSTGGYDEKTPGRVGDVPVIGAGTYAHDASAALSATGWGEWFIRHVAAHEVSSRMRYREESLEAAMRAVLSEIREPAGATGGFIGVTPAGGWAAEYSSQGMLRGVATHAAPIPKVGIFETLE